MMDSELWHVIYEEDLKPGFFINNGPYTFSGFVRNVGTQFAMALIDEDEQANRARATFLWGGGSLNPCPLEGEASTVCHGDWWQVLITAPAGSIIKDHKHSVKAFVPFDLTSARIEEGMTPPIKSKEANDELEIEPT